MELCSPLQAPQLATKWIAYGLLAKPLLYFAFGESSLSVDTKNAKIQLGTERPQEGGFYERTIKYG